MHALLRNVFAVAGVALATQAVAQITFYGQDNFRGQSFTTQRQINNLERFGFNDRASSAMVVGERWEVCEDIRFGGRCVVLRAGRYPSLAAMGLNDRVSSARTLSRNVRVDEQRYAPALPQITFFERENYRGRSVTSDQQIDNFQTQNFNDRASSVTVTAGMWEVCENAGFSGRCMILRPGQYPSLQAMGLNDHASSVRPVSNDVRPDDRRDVGRDDRRDMSAPVAPDFRRHNNERLYQARVTSVRAVVGPSDRRCWIEREQVAAESDRSNVPAAVAGALIGGILGHQVGGGVGKDLATVGGAVAGAALGAQAGRNDNQNQPGTRDVQRCREVPSQVKPEFWDVTYNFRGQDHQVQMTAPPGTTVTVNGQGEPRN